MTDTVIPRSFFHRLVDPRRYGGPWIEDLDLAELRELLPCDGVDAATEASRHGARVRAAGEHEGSFLSEDLHSAQAVTAAAAEGRALMVDDLAPAYPQIQALIDAAEEGMGVPPGSCSAKLSVTPTGRGFPVHFDRFDSWQFQLHGTKIWLVCRDAAVVNPPVTQALAAPLHPALRDLVSEDPTTADMEAFEVAAGPDSLLAMPRGFWHATSAAKPSVTFVIRSSAPSAVWVLPATLRRARLTDPRWRELIVGARRGHPRRDDALARLQMMLDEDVPDHDLSASELVDRFDYDAYRRDLDAMAAGTT